MTEQDSYYEDLTERLLGPDPVKVNQATVLRGKAAAAAGHAMLLAEYGSEKAIGQAIRAGRPRVGDAKRGPSPTVRGRIADDDFAALVRLEEQSGKSQSALVRKAIHLLLQKHERAS